MFIVSPSCVRKFGKRQHRGALPVKMTSKERAENGTKRQKRRRAKEKAGKRTYQPTR